MRHRLGEGCRRERGDPRLVGPARSLEGDERERGHHEERRRHGRDAGRGGHSWTSTALLLEPRLEATAEVGGRLDRYRSLQGKHPAPQSAVVPLAGPATDEMALEAAQLARLGHQPVTKIGIALEKLGTAHDG